MDDLLNMMKVFTVLSFLAVGFYLIGHRQGVKDSEVIMGQQVRLWDVINKNNEETIAKMRVIMKAQAARLKGNLK